MESFKGFWIPEQLMNLDISWTKRILLAEINQLSMLDKGCVASNNHFATKLRITKQAVSKALNELSKDGLLSIDNAQTKRNFGRTITINFSESAINFSKSGVHQSGEPKESNTINKTISSKKPKQALEEILNELEEKFAEIVTEMKYPLNREAFLEWDTFRKSKRKPISEMAMKMQLRKLCAYPRDIQKQMIDQSIENDYQGLFEVKQPNKNFNAPEVNSIGWYEQQAREKDNAIDVEVG